MLRNTFLYILPLPLPTLVVPISPSAQPNLKSPKHYLVGRHLRVLLHVIMHYSHNSAGDAASHSPVSGFTPSVFPLFSRQVKDAGGSAAARRPTASVGVPVEQKNKLLELLSADPDGFAAVLWTAWALFLRCYTGQNALDFVFQRGGSRNQDDCAGELLAARVVLDESSSLPETLRRTQVELATCTPTVPPNLVDQIFHTAVVLWDTTDTSSPCDALASVF